MVHRTIRVEYPAAEVHHPIIQGLMAYAQDYGVTVNINGASMTDASAMFILYFEADVDGHFNSLEQHLREHGLTVTAIPD